MRAVQFTRFGVPEEVAEVVELADPPDPQAGQVIVDLLASPINPADLLNLRGMYGVVPPLPAFGGFEGVGQVSAVGEGVTNVKLGDRVLLSGSVWRERQTVSAAGLFALPADLPVDQLAMLTVNPLTARAMLQLVEPKPGEFVIVNAANSGVGRVLFALAKRAGLRGIAVVRRGGLEELLKGWGAELVVVDGPDLAERVRAAIGGGALRLGVDAVGGAATARLAGCLSPGGTVVNYGLLSGEACQMSAGDLVFRGVKLHGFWIGHWFRVTPPDQIGAAIGEVLAALAAGQITTPIEARYPLGRVREALQHAALDGRAGKVILQAG